MITLCRSSDRLHVAQGEHDVWLTCPPRDRFASLAGLSEMRFAPGSRAAPHAGDEEEILTYVFKGAMAHEDSTGVSGVIHAGEFQHMTTGRGVRHTETNASQTDRAHVFRIVLRPRVAGLDRAHVSRRFAAAQRRNVMCVVASPDGRRDSLLVHQDVLIYSSVLDPGHHVIHELRAARSAWLHVVHGEATVNDMVLTGGDGVGVADEPSLSFTAQESSEILLVDVGPHEGPMERMP